MRLLVGVHQFPPFGSGGTEQLARWTARGMIERGHEATIVSAVPRRHARGEWRTAIARDEDGLDVRFIDPGDAKPSFPARVESEYDSAEAGERFAREIDSVRPDVIHFFHLAGLTASAAAAARQRGVPYVFTASDFWFECPTVQLLLDDGSLCAGPRDDRMNCARHLAAIRWPAMRAFAGASVADRPAASGIALLSRTGIASGAGRSLRALQGRSDALRKALHGAAAVIAPNDLMRERLLAFGVRSPRLHLVPYAVPGLPAAERKRVRNERMRVLFVGTLAPSKGAHVLLEALRLAPDLDADVDLYGEASDAGYAAKLREIAGKDARVHFRGTFASERFADVVGAADLLVIPSVWIENSPLVLLQALALRCPVLVSDVAGLATHLRGPEDGWTFARASAKDLARQLRYVALDGDAREAVRAAPYPVHTLPRYLGEVESLYGACVAAREVSQ